MEAGLCEINRVLQAGGTLLNLFPDKSIWREGHCGVPFLHWFSRHSTLRIYYALLWRSIGFGNFTEGKSAWNGQKSFVPGLINGLCIAVMGRSRWLMESISRRCST